MRIEQIISKIDATLVSGFAALDGWFDDERVGRRIAAHAWSAAEVLEHVMLTNHYLLKLIRRGHARAKEIARQNDGPALPGDYVFFNPALEAVADPESFLWDCPEHMLPSGVAPAVTVRHALRGQLYECLNILDDMPKGEGAWHRVSLSVNSIGKLDIYQHIYFLALHVKRHVVQLNRVHDAGLKWQAGEELEGHNA